MINLKINNIIMIITIIIAGKWWPEGGVGVSSRRWAYLLGLWLREDITDVGGAYCQRGMSRDYGRGLDYRTPIEYSCDGMQMRGAPGIWAWLIEYQGVVSPRLQEMDRICRWACLVDYPDPWISGHACNSIPSSSRSSNTNICI